MSLSTCKIIRSLHPRIAAWLDKTKPQGPRIERSAKQSAPRDWLVLALAVAALAAALGASLLWP